MHPAEINMDALVREIVHQLEPDCANRKFEWQIAPLPRVHGDAALLRQVWFNLIENAVKYTRNCPLAHIEIGSQQNTSDPRVFFVRDNGVGFDMKYVEKLFGVFQRLHRSDEFEGTGIGLANVRRIVHRHGGRTWAEAEPGKGATFYFSMPQNNNDHDTQHVSI
jgi:light-regulated signal transduction histidine kinase (bacteriophytochrome)